MSLGIKRTRPLRVATKTIEGTVADLPRPLNAYTSWWTGSYRIASGFSPVFTVATIASVFRSTMLTVDSRPLLTKPRPKSDAVKVVTWVSVKV